MLCCCKKNSHPYEMNACCFFRYLVVLCPRYVSLMFRTVLTVGVYDKQVQTLENALNSNNNRRILRRVCNLFCCACYSFVVNLCKFTLVTITRKLWYRKDDRAMRAIYVDREPLRKYGHLKLYKMAASAILNLFESKIAPLDPPSPKTPPYNQT